MGVVVVVVERCGGYLYRSSRLVTKFLYRGGGSNQDAWTLFCAIVKLIGGSERQIACEQGNKVSPAGIDRVVISSAQIVVDSPLQTVGAWKRIVVAYARRRFNVGEDEVLVHEARTSGCHHRRMTPHAPTNGRIFEWDSQSSFVDIHDGLHMHELTTMGDQFSRQTTAIEIALSIRCKGQNI